MLWLAFAGIAGADRAWLPPDELTPPGTRGQGQVAIAADGTIVAAWVQQLQDWTEDPDYGSKTMAAVIRPGDTTIEPVELQRENGGAMTLAANSRGDAVVVWHDLPNRRLMASRLIAGTRRFLPPEPLPGPDQVTSQESPVAINEKGDIAVVDRDWRAWEMGGSHFGWIAPAGLPFGPARLLGAHVDYGLSGPSDVAIGLDGRATLLYEDVPHLNPDMGPTGPSRIGAVTWSAPPGEPHAEWVHTVPKGNLLGCSELGIDDQGRLAAQWLDGTSTCHARDNYDDGPAQIAWRDAGAADFDAPLDGDTANVTQTLDGLSLSGKGEALALYHPEWRRQETRVALAAPFEPLAERQTLEGEPVDADLSPAGHALAVLARGRPSGSYGADLVVARRAPDAPFGAAEALRTDCAPGSIYSHGAINDSGQAAVLTTDGDPDTWVLRLHRDTEVAPGTRIACDGNRTPPPPDPSPGSPLPPLPPPLPPGAVVSAGDGVVFGRPRIARAGRVRTVTLAVRCAASCDVAGRGQLVDRVRVLARARGAARVAAGKSARLRLRFRLSRRAVRAVRTKRRAARFAFDLAVRRPGAPPSSHRFVARAR